jgi:plasmid stabilization system protein ParE
VKGFRRYLIFYHPFKDGIEIIRVLAAERDLKSIFHDPAGG